MTDQMIPADKVENIAAEMRDAMRREDDGYPYAEFLSDMGDYIKDLEALLPDQPRPSMAEMTEEERAECRWMQCDAGPYGRRGLIVKVKYWSVYVVDKETGTYSDYTPDLVTARPDLPSMEWNGTDQEDVTPDHLAVGTVIESADDPRLDALPAGSALLDRDGEAVAKRGKVWAGDGYHPIPSEGDEFGPWTVLHIPKEADQ